MGLDRGRIPWNRILEYGLFLGLREPVLSHFIRVIKSLDLKYIQHMRELEAKARPKTTKGDAEVDAKRARRKRPR